MIFRKANERGILDLDWIKSHHSFSFGCYLDPEWMGFKNLKVLNSNCITARKTTPPTNVSQTEIVTLVIKGELLYKDSLGQNLNLKTGDFQSVLCGDGFSYSFSNSQQEDCEFLQLWFESKGEFDSALACSGKYQDQGKIELLYSSKGSNFQLSFGLLSDNYEVRENTWVQIVSGEFKAEDLNLSLGDGLGVGEAITLECVKKGFVCLIEFV